MSAGPSIADFVKERNEMLLSGDIDRALAFWEKWSPEFKPSSRLVAEAAMHKARTADASLPIEARRESKQWLTAHRLESFDDGDL